MAEDTTRAQAQAAYESADPFATYDRQSAADLAKGGSAGQGTAKLGPGSIAYEKSVGGEANALKAYHSDREKEKAKEAADAREKALQAQIQAIQNSPWAQMSRAIGQEYQQATVPVAAAISGSNIPQAQSSAASNALASLGLSPSSSAGQWLQSQTGAAQAATAPVAQAMAQQGAQYQAEVGPISQAIQAYGEANALQDITAPEASWLSALASHVTSNLSYQGAVPTAAIPSMAPAVVTAMKTAGGYPGSSAAGLTPLQNVQAAPGGGSQATKTPATTGGGTNLGIIPSAGGQGGSPSG